MTDTTVTPELLLWLAGKVAPFLTKEQYGKECSSPWRTDMEPRYDAASDCVSGYRTWYDEQTGEIGGWDRFKWNNPARDPAQFGRLVVWAALNGLEPMLAKRHAFAGLVGTSSDYTQAHDSTESGIMAAATIAIARALGWEGGHESTT